MNKKIISAILSLCITINLTGCAKKNIQTENFSKTSEVEILDDLIIDYLKLIKETNISFSEDITFNSNEETQITNEINNINECSKEIIINSDEIYNNIIDNSEKYLESKDTTYHSVFNDDNYMNTYTNKLDITFNNEIMIQIKDYIKDSIYNEISYIISTSTSKDDFHNLSELKIIYKDSINDDEINTYATFKNNTITIYLDNIMNSSSNMFNILVISNHTIKHEFNHLRQTLCTDEKNGTNDITNILSTTSFLTEASAESSIYNQNRTSAYLEYTNDYNYLYPTERQLESKLFLMNMLDNTKSLDDYYNAIYSNSLNKLLIYFNANTKESKIEILKIIYGMNAMYLNNDYLLNTLNISINDITPDDIYNYFKFSINNAILKRTITHFIKYNLTYNDLTLEDNYILLSLIESVLVSDSARLVNNTSIGFYEEYYNDFTKLKNIYIEFLSSKYNKDYDTIINEYSSCDKDNWLSYLKSKSIYGKNSTYTLSTSDKERIDTLLSKYPKIQSIINANEYLSYELVSDMNILFIDNQDMSANGEKLVKIK